MLEVQNLSYEANGFSLLNNISFTIVPGQMPGLIGPNGAGKSTLLKIIAGLYGNYTGTVHLDGVELKEINPFKRAKKVCWLPQTPLPDKNISVEQVLYLGKQVNLSDDLNISALLTDFDLLHLRNAKLATLSGGEHCRVMLARMVAGNPDIYLLDEPLSAQDSYYQLQVLEYFTELCATGKTVIMTLHDLNLFYRYCDTGLLMNNGRLEFHEDIKDLVHSQTLSRLFSVDIGIIEQDSIENLYIAAKKPEVL